jgi:hypothetical protein
MKGLSHQRKAAAPWQANLGVIPFRLNISKRANIASIIRKFFGTTLPPVAIGDLGWVIISHRC